MKNFKNILNKIETIFYPFIFALGINSIISSLGFDTTSRIILFLVSFYIFVYRVYDKDTTIGPYN